MIKKVNLLGLLVASSFYISAQITITKDLNFGNNGVVEIDNSDYYIKINDTETFKPFLFQDDKIFVSYCSVNNNAITKYTRLNHNGSIDTSFGVSGIITSYNFEDTYFFANDTFFYTKSGKKFLNNGQLDSNFGINGSLTYDIPSYQFVLPDGKILSRNGTDFKKYLGTGVLDGSYGNSGSVVIVSSLYYDYMSSDSHLLDTANPYFFENVWSIGYPVRIRKIDIQQGVLDSNYGNSGYAEIKSPINSSQFNFYAGSSFHPQYNFYINKFDDLDGNFQLTKTNSDGLLDNTFGNNGVIEKANAFTYNGKDYLGGEVKAVLYKDYIIITSQGSDSAGYLAMRAFSYDGNAVTINNDLYYAFDNISFDPQLLNFKTIINGDYLYVFFDNKIARYRLNGSSLHAEENNLETGVKIINPFKDVLKIVTPKNIKEVQIFDANGKMVFKGLNTKQIETNHFVKGIYFIQLITDDGKVVRNKITKN